MWVISSIRKCNWKTVRYRNSVSFVKFCTTRHGSRSIPGTELKVHGIIIYIIKGDMSVCLFRMAGLTAGPIEIKLDTCPPREFLARSISRSLMYACGSDRKPVKTARQRHLSNGARTTSGRRTTAAATPSERLQNAVELHSSSKVRGDSGEAPKVPSSERRSREQNSVRRTGN